MPIIKPVSELRNYGQILEQVKQNSPVYLTKNGHGAFSLRRIEDEEEFEKMRSLVMLLTELNRGFRSGEEEGWISEEAVRSHFSERRRAVQEDRTGK